MTAKTNPESGIDASLAELRETIIAYADGLSRDGTDSSLHYPSLIGHQLHSLFDTQPDLAQMIRERPALKHLTRDQAVEFLGEMLGVIAGLFQPRGREIARSTHRELYGSGVGNMARKALSRRQEANAVVSFAFRTGYLEDLHAGKHSELLDDPELSRITNPEMKRLMIEACRKLDRLMRLKEDDPDTYWVEIAHHAMYTQGWEQE